MPKIVNVKASKRAVAHKRTVGGNSVKPKGEFGNTFSPNSAFIHKVSHNPQSNVMYVNFKNGSTYAYNGVDRKTFQKMQKAESTGKYFHSNIKNKYSSTKFQ